MTRKRVLASFAGLALAGCATVAFEGAEVVTLRDSTGRTVGMAQLVPDAEGVRVVLSVNGLPAGEHGVHVHQNGQCDAPDFTTAGPHFNPSNRQHGLENPNGAHDGDLPNITVDANGRGSLTATVRDVTLNGTGGTSLRKPGGTSLMVHANADDYNTDPSGNSGARIACAVIPPQD
jgi:Cu-Zn family superoxide dismutase